MQYTFGNNFVTLSGAIPVNMTATGDQALELDAPIAPAANEYEIDDVGIPLIGAKAFLFIANADMVIKTNIVMTPGDTITLVAGVPYSWITGNGDNPLLAAITKLFVTSTAGGVLKVRALFDVLTP